MKLGIMGASHISHTVIPALLKIDGLEVAAVGARDLSRAQNVAGLFGIPKAYGSYEELLSDPELDLIYVSTSHAFHYQHVMMCLEHGKNVICEKAFMLNAKEARLAAEYARKKQLFLCEAMWTRYQPSRKLINDMIASGIVGDIHMVKADLSYELSAFPSHTALETAGGALLDIGVYGINFCLMHLGKNIERIDSSVQFCDKGTDSQECLTLNYKDGKMAVLTHSSIARGDRRGVFYGDKGFIVVENINNPQSVAAYTVNEELIKYEKVPEQINGYEYEFIEAVKCIGEGLTEAPSMPLDESIFLMETMDSIRKDWNFVYPMELL